MPHTNTVFRACPSSSISASTMERELSLAVAIVVRDEERCVGRCIDSLLKTDVDEILVLDTGSRDQTRDIVREYGDTRVSLHRTEWTGSFARARNHAMTLLSSDWVFFLDADEWLMARPRELKPIVQAAASVYGNQCTFSPRIVEHGSPTLYLDIPRIMHVGTTRFDGSIHEYPVLVETPGTLPGLVGIEIQVEHDGYSENVVEGTQKVARNLKIIEESLAREPSNPRLLFYRLRDGASVFDVAEVLACLASFNQMLIGSEGDPHLPEEYYQRAMVCGIDRLITLGAWTDALLVCADLDAVVPGPHPDAEYFRGVSDLHFGEVDANSLLRLIQLRKDVKFVKRSQLDSSGRQLDAVIGAKLFFLRGRADANAYLRECEPWTDRFFDASVWR